MTSSSGFKIPQRCGVNAFLLGSCKWHAGHHHHNSMESGASDIYHWLDAQLRDVSLSSLPCPWLRLRVPETVKAWGPSLTFLLNLKCAAPYTERSWVFASLKWVMFIFPLLPVPFLNEEDQWTISAHMTSGNRGSCQSIFFFLRERGKKWKNMKGLTTDSSMTPFQTQYYPNKIMCCLYFFSQQGLRVHLFVLHCLLGTV